MADYIKFRLTAAKAGVTMAFLALLGGLVGPAEGRQREPAATAASFSWGSHYLKLDGLQGATKQAFLKLELKLGQVFGDVNHTLTRNFYDKHKIDTTFLKIDAANNEFLKLDSANAQFLKIVNANNDFLKLDGIAANSSELGGLTPDAFVQGHANVVSGMASITDGTSQPLMKTPDGLITVNVSVDGNGNQFLVIHNGTSSDLTAVVDPTAVEKSLPAGADTQIPLGNLNSPGTTVTNDATMTHLQIFPGGSLREVVTMTVSSEPPVNGGPNTVVGQMLIGLL
ncbi:MAG TPA: hypothetical protein VMP89_19635 [Solirubrobacteraceae bacterium]|nr:hypothetical protein [Solirubrobacteraceae bacterium]